MKVIGDLKKLSCAEVIFSKAMLVSKNEINVLKMSHNMRIPKTCFMSLQGTLVKEMRRYFTGLLFTPDLNIGFTFARCHKF